MNTAAKSNYPPTYDNGKPRKTVGQIVSYIVLVLWAFISVFPVYWMLTFSLKTNEEIFGENVIGLPKYWVWDNYTRAMNTGDMPRYFLNSVIVAVSTIAITLLAAVMIAKFVGCSLPILADKLGFDPAVMASPFITTIVDALSLLIFCGFAGLLLTGTAA